MQHRHLNHDRLTLAAIDDVIERGSRQDWAALREAVRAQPSLAEKIQRLCARRLADPSAQRYHLWHRYAEQHTG